MRFELELATSADKQAIEDVFACVRESCELRIRPPQRQILSYAKGIHELPDSALRMGEVLVRVGALTADELAGALRAQRARREDKVRPIGTILVEEGYVASELVYAVASRQAEIRERAANDSKTLKVPLERLDELIRLLEGLSGGLARATTPRELTAQASAALGLALSLRSVQVADCFARLERLVRDLSLELGKEIDLHLFGGELSIDRALAESLLAAVTHLVRNAIDHGIEAPEARLQVGKPQRGTLHLSLEALGEGLLLELADDGRGIDSQHLLQVALDKGLINAGSEPPDRESLLALVLKPGFSTREEASRYSGRGVGLDAVNESVLALGGRIHISSEVGRGTRFTIVLPGQAPTMLTEESAQRASA